MAARIGHNKYPNVHNFFRILSAILIHPRSITPREMFPRWWRLRWPNCNNSGKNSFYELGNTKLQPEVTPVSTRFMGRNWIWVMYFCFGQFLLLHFLQGYLVTTHSGRGGWHRVHRVHPRVHHEVHSCFTVALSQFTMGWGSLTYRTGGMWMEFWAIWNYWNWSDYI